MDYAVGLRSGLMILAATVGLACGGGNNHAPPDTSVPDTTTDAGESSGDTGSSEAPAAGVGRSGMRRLTRTEFDATLRDILFDDSRPAVQLLPEDARVPFDNDADLQTPTQPLVESLEVLARDAARRLVDDPERLARVLGCSPTGADDATCMQSFVSHFGRLALRHPLSDADVAEFSELGLGYAKEAEDFNTGVEVVIRSLLQDPEFVYRIEVGTPVPEQPGLFQLSPFELGSRMSFLLWGSTPDDALLDAAESGMLDDPDGIRSMAAAMLDDPRARDQVDRFHAMWLGYVELPHAQALTDAMRTETAALVERVVFDEDASWLDLFTADETYIDATLAAIYGLPAPPSGTAAWVPWGDTGRRGLLSQGSFLSAAANVGDTSPTKRGKFVRERLMCQTVPPPPPDANADNPPEANTAECKADRYRVHSEGTCAGCHSQMDPIGFGLENYDRTGRFREHDDDKPQCIIDGMGEITGLGTFRGPAELAQMLVDHGSMGPCVARQLYQFAVGRQLEAEDEPFIESIATDFTAGEYRFSELLLGVVTHEAFRFRREN